MPMSQLDAGQIIKSVYDENGKIRVAAEVTANISAAQEVVIDSQDDSIAVGDAAGNLVTTTNVGPDVGLDVNIIGGVVSGEFSATGLSTGLKTQEIIITDVATKIPGIPLADRNGMSVRIWNPLDTSIVVYIGSSTVTANNGYPKLHGEEITLDIKENAAVELYGICETGKTAKVRILELA